MLRRRLPHDVYNRAITFLYGRVDEINAALRRDCPIDFEPLHPSCQGHYKCYVNRAGLEADYLCLIRTGARDHQVAVLAHETLHLVAHALLWAGIALSEETDEAYCYYQQWIMRECLRAMRR